MRTGFSTRMQQYMYGSNTSEVAATLMQIHHPLLTQDLFYINKGSAVNGNAVNTTTGALIPGQVFQAKGFTVPLPSELTGTLPTMTFTLDNTDLTTGYALLSTANGNKVDCWLQLVLLSDTSTPQFGPCHFKCPQVAADFDTGKIVLTLTFEDGLNEMFPVPGMTPYGYPALYGITNPS
jgi:hypothetical protein